MSGPPVFTSEQGRWSIGSEVVAFWWIQTEDEDGEVAMTQHHDVAIVARLHRERGVGAWRATVTFGPMLDLVHPTEYDPADLLAAAPYDPGAAAEAWGENGGGLVP